MLDNRTPCRRHFIGTELIEGGARWEGFYLDFCSWSSAKYLAHRVEGGAGAVSGIDTRYINSMVRQADIYVLSGLLAQRGQWSYRSLAERLRVPHPVVQRGLGRAGSADLYSAGRREVNPPHFEEFALHALRFLAPAELGGIVPGVPAAWAAEPIASAIRSSVDEPPPVWPHASGEARGQAFEPLHPAAAEAVEEWSELGEILAMLDSLRAGDARIRRVAERLLAARLRERAGAVSS